MAGRGNFQSRIFSSVARMVGRYHSDIKYWEVWNEFNGNFAENGTPEMYPELVREASIEAKKTDPSAKISMSNRPAG
jgi:hypothetical protein